MVDDFYASLKITIEKVPKEDLILIMGDFNARVGEQQHQTARWYYRYTYSRQNQ